MITEREKLEYAIKILAEWCNAITENGTGWDYWDDYYKEVKWSKDCPIRKELDKLLIME